MSYQDEKMSLFDQAGGLLHTGAFLGGVTEGISLTPDNQCSVQEGFIADGLKSLKKGLIDAPRSLKMMNECGVKEVQKIGRESEEAIKQGDYKKAIKLKQKCVEEIKKVRDRVGKLDQNKYSKDSIDECKKILTSEISMTNNQINKLKEKL